MAIKSDTNLTELNAHDIRKVYMITSEADLGLLQHPRWSAL